VAGSIPIAVGAALALRLQGKEAVVLCFFGDGATNEGGFHEAINLGSIWKLPVVFLCENNQYGMSMLWKKAVAIERLSDRASAYGIPGVTVDGNDVVEVREAVREAVDRARGGNGPSLVEAVTYRYRGHSKSDQQLYRTRDEVDEWRQQRDPITRFARFAIEQSLLSEEDVRTLEAEAGSLVERAVEEAKDHPDPSLAGIEEEVYA
jgi:TPP-dependent pyruvate/acetoin dehydrogenase alpha subunit